MFYFTLLLEIDEQLYCKIDESKITKSLVNITKQICVSDELFDSKFMQDVRNDYNFYCTSKRIIDATEEKTRQFFGISSISSFISADDETNLFREFRYYFLYYFRIEFSPESHNEKPSCSMYEQPAKMQKKDKLKDAKKVSQSNSSKMKITDKKQSRLSFGSMAQ